MPSAKGYKRNYKQEMATATARDEDTDRTARNRARRHAIKSGRVTVGDKRDIDHKAPLRASGSTSDSNTRVRSRKANRSDNGHKPKGK